MDAEVFISLLPGMRFHLAEPIPQKLVEDQQSWCKSSGRIT